MKTRMIISVLFLTMISSLVWGEGEKQVEVVVSPVEEEPALVLGAWEEMDPADLNEDIVGFIRRNHLNETEVELTYEDEDPKNVIPEKVWVQPVQGLKYIVMYQIKEAAADTMELGIAVIWEEPGKELTLMEIYRGKEVFDFIASLLKEKMP
jgi:hypothetical protein